MSNLKKCLPFINLNKDKHPSIGYDGDSVKNIPFNTTDVSDFLDYIEKLFIDKILYYDDSISVEDYISNLDYNYHFNELGKKSKISSGDKFVSYSIHDDFYNGDTDVEDLNIMISKHLPKGNIIIGRLKDKSKPGMILICDEESLSQDVKYYSLSEIGYYPQNQYRIIKKKLNS